MFAMQYAGLPSNTRHEKINWQYR